MLLYRLRGRILQFEGGVSPRFPADVIVRVSLAPEVPFGGVAGTSRNAVRDTTGKVRVNLSTGRAVVEWSKPMFEPVTASTAIAGTSFEANKNVVSVRASEQDVTDLLAAVFYAFPAVLNLYVPDAPFPTHAWGQLGTARFSWIFEPNEVVASCTVTSKDHQERRSRMHGGM